MCNILSLFFVSDSIAATVMIPPWIIWQGWLCHKNNEKNQANSSSSSSLNFSSIQQQTRGCADTSAALKIANEPYAAAVILVVLQKFKLWRPKKMIQ